jgi:hypothetical protein
MRWIVITTLFFASGCASYSLSLPFTKPILMSEDLREYKPKREKIVLLTPDSMPQIGHRFFIRAEVEDSSEGKPVVYCSSENPAILHVTSDCRAWFLYKREARACARVSHFVSDTNPNRLLRSGSGKNTCRTYRPTGG